MSIAPAEVCTAFAKHVLASGKLPELQSLAKDVDNTVEESHKLLREIKALYLSMNNKTEERLESDTKDDIARHEEIAKFLASGPPRLLLPDMEHMYNLELDVEKTLAKTAAILEKIRSKDLTFPSTRTKSNFDFNSDFTDYAHSLEQFGVRLAHISTIETDKEFKRDLGLESKLQSLTDDVDQLWKVRNYLIVLFCRRMLLPYSLSSHFLIQESYCSHIN